MKINIPFSDKVLSIEFENSLDITLLEMLNNRYLNYGGKWSINRVEAVKHCRQVKGGSLTDAVKYVDALIQKNGIKIVVQYDFSDE